MNYKKATVDAIVSGTINTVTNGLSESAFGKYPKGWDLAGKAASDANVSFNTEVVTNVTTEIISTSKQRSGYKTASRKYLQKPDKKKKNTNPVYKEYAPIKSKSFKTYNSVSKFKVIMPRILFPIKFAFAPYI